MKAPEELKAKVQKHLDAIEMACESEGVDANELVQELMAQEDEGEAEAPAEDENNEGDPVGGPPDESGDEEEEPAEDGDKARRKALIIGMLKKKAGKA